ncbi:3-oxoacyl-reductase [Ephemerocybe angulata]|uniref:3-oxoacyl-reductase n=1 Tax=Ephemerocybe angulata TaxID=980116 RepID=A0A8H6I9K5_9AGAR|nr:3-oxoacyl-reductase [Tulosesus angulatus]
MSSYDNVRHKGKSAEEHHKSTLARIDQIQTQFKAPGSGKLKGKVCIITGVGSLKGIGRATSIGFAREGATHLYLLDYDGTNLPNLKETIQSQYPSVKSRPMLPTRKLSQGFASRLCAEEGRLDVFFANAGWASRDTLHNTTAEIFMEAMRINALSVFLAVKHASSAMLQTNSSRGKDRTGGSIILTASTAGIRSGAGTVDYSASKAAVNSIAKTFGVAEEIANAALFLASDDSSYVNGQNIAVDGGLSASHPVVPGRWA